MWFAFAAVVPLGFGLLLDCFSLVLNILALFSLARLCFCFWVLGLNCDVDFGEFGYCWLYVIVLWVYCCVALLRLLRLVVFL